MEPLAESFLRSLSGVVSQESIDLLRKRILDGTPESIIEALENISSQLHSPNDAASAASKAKKESLLKELPHPSPDQEGDAIQRDPVDELKLAQDWLRVPMGVAGRVWINREPLNSVDGDEA